MLNRGEHCAPLRALQRKVQFFDKLGSLCRESSCRVALSMRFYSPCTKMTRISTGSTKRK